MSRCIIPSALSSILAFEALRVAAWRAPLLWLAGVCLGWTFCLAVEDLRQERDRRRMKAWLARVQEDRERLPGS